MFEEGPSVRRRDDPSQVGIITGETRENGGHVYIRIKFFNGEAKWIL